MNTTYPPSPASETLSGNLADTLADIVAGTATGTVTGSGLDRTHQTETLPARLDVHRLEEFRALCTTNISRDLLLDASEVRFIDTAALAFLEDLDTARRTAGAAVHYLRPSPALTATFELHGSKLADPELMVR